MDEMTLDQRRAVAMANARMRAAEAEGQPMSGDELTPPAPEPRFGEKVNAAISSIPRQAGLAARYGVEGMADVAGIVTNPIAATANAMGANLPRLRDATSGVLDK